MLDRARITYGVIQTPEEAADDPQLRANDIVVPLDGVSGPGRDRQQPDHRPRGGQGPARRAPELGEHNDEVLRELGFSVATIERLRPRRHPRCAEREAA